MLSNNILIKKSPLVILCSSLLLASSTLFAEDKIVATVNGHSIPESQVEIAAQQSQIDFKKITPEQKKLLIEALVNRQLILDKAIEAGFDKDPGIVARVRALTESYIAANYLAEIAEKYKSSDAEMKAYYDKNIVANAAKEYKARHILVKTEDEAKAIIKNIESGADFSAVAKEKSTDIGSGAKGGDLGWFKKQNMVAPFANAVASMKKGQLNKTPIQSQFGWHVIILDDERTATPPAYDDVKKNIDKELIKEKLTQYLDDLNKKAKIELK